MNFDISKLKAGDFVRAEFQHLTEEYAGDGLYTYWLGEPDGTTYELSGVVKAYSDGKTLNIDQGGDTKCLRQPDGNPGGWLVEILEHVPAEDLPSIDPSFSLGH